MYLRLNCKCITFKIIHKKIAVKINHIIKTMLTYLSIVNRLNLLGIAI